LQRIAPTTHTPSILLLLLMIFTSASANSAQDLSKLDKDIAKIAERYDVPSVAYALFTPNNDTHINTIGFADIKNQHPATSSTKYRIASVSKMIVGIAVMQLVESHQVSLDDKVNTLLPDLAFENAWRTTHPLQVKHLLENTTGWDDMSLREYAFDNTLNISLKEALAVNPKSRISRWPPGTRHAYTNTAAAVAALIVERITGMPFSSYAKQYILSPIGIKNASFENYPKNVALGYDNHQNPRSYKPVLMSYAGNVTMNIADMAVLLKAMVKRDNRLFGNELYERVEHSYTTNVGYFESGYGIFNHARFYDGWLYRGHDGAFRGWRSELAYLPAHQSGFVVLQNSDNDAAFRQIVNVLHKHLAANVQQNDSTVESQGAVLPDTLEGYYRYHNPRNKVRWFLERLISPYLLSITPTHTVFSSAVFAGWKRELRYQQDGRLINNKGHVVGTFAQDPVLGDVLHYGDRVFKKISAFDAWSDKVVGAVWLLLALLLLPFTLIWLVRACKGRYTSPDQRNLYLSLVCCVLITWIFIGCLTAGLLAPIPRLGSVTFVSVGLMISSVLLVPSTLFAFWKLATQYALFNRATTRFVSSVFIVANTIVVIYLGWFGVLGLRTWI